MKKITSLKIAAVALFLPIAFSVNAQTADYFPEGSEWCQKTIHLMQPCVDLDDYVLSIAGDSTIGAYSYKKIYKQGVVSQQHYQSYHSNQPPCASPVYYGTYLFGLVRQDEKRMYQYDAVYGDTLLYNFDLELGDPAPETFHNFNQGFVVTAVDSVLVGPSYRKVFTFNNSTSRKLIEGLGAVGGLLIPHLPNTPNYQTGYFTYAINGTGYYPTFNSYYCQATLSVSENELNSFTAWPNPTTGKMIVRTGSQVEKIDLITFTGQTFPLEFQDLNGEQELNLSFLRPGLYLLSVSITGGQTATLRIVKE